jgi:MoaA/NifB/PqqE/SkfB family radical SAM enzyme
MINIDNVHKIELEITSDCNAACPGCARTLNKDILRVNHFTLQDLQRMFPDERHIRRKDFRLCGVLGDPAIHPELVPMVEYLLTNGGIVTISTNGGVGPRDMWYRLGQLSDQYKDNFIMMFCIDGHKETNHIYRVNTKWNIVERNVTAFCENSFKEGNNKWVFIVFDHNEHEVEIAKAHAKSLGLKFLIRTGMRNSYFQWTAEIAKKEARGSVKKEKVKITTTGDKEHKRKDEVLELDKLIETNQVDEKVINTIVCKYIHEGEIFINSHQEMWPCCFLWDSAFKNKENILEKLSEYQTGWNSLKHQTIEDVMKHPWYTKVLEESWNPTHSKHLNRCVKSCGFNKAYQNVMVEQK